MSSAGAKFRLALVTGLAGVAGYAGAGFLTSPTAELPSPGTMKAVYGTVTVENVVPSPDSVPSPTAALARLAETRTEKDFFRRAAKAFEAVEQLTAADFAAVAASGKIPPPLDGYADSELKRAMLDAFVERWLALDSKDAVGAILQLSSRGGEKKWAPGSRDFRAALARLRPMDFLAAGAKLPPAETKDDFFWPWGIAYTTLAHTDPEAARRLAAQLPKEKSKAAAQAIALGVAESDPAAAIPLLKGIQRWDSTGIMAAAVRQAERAGPGVVRQLLEAGRAAMGDNEELIALAARYPEFGDGYAFGRLGVDRLNMEMRAELRGSVEELSVAELQKRIQAADQIPAGLRKAMVGEMAEAWAVQEPAAATAWALARCEQEGSRDDLLPVLKAFAVWREKDWKGALAWLQSLPASDQKTALGNRAALALMQRGEFDGALRLYSQPSGNLKYHEYFTVRIDAGSQANEMSSTVSEGDLIAYHATQHDPAQAVAWAATLPVGNQYRNFLHDALGEWVARDAAAAAQWVEALLEGQQRDKAFAHIARSVAARDSAAAAEWVDSILDPEQRGSATRGVYGLMATFDPAGAREWLRARPALTAQEKDKLIRFR